LKVNYKIIIYLKMELYTKLKKIGEGKFGDVSLVQRKSDGKVYLMCYL